MATARSALALPEEGPVMLMTEEGLPPPLSQEDAFLKWVTDKCRAQSIIGLEEGWKRLEEHGTKKLESILTDSSSSPKVVFTRKGFASLYTLSYKMCSQPAVMDWSEELYRRHQASIQAYLRRVVVPALRSKHDEYLLRAFVKHWEDHKIMTKWMYRLFMHLDKSYINNGQLPTLTSNALRLFKNHVYDVYKGALVETIMGMINRERDGQAIDRSLVQTFTAVVELMGITATHTQLRSLSQALTLRPDLRVYRNDLEAPFVAGVHEYYSRCGQEWLIGSNTAQYLLQVERTLADEHTRVTQLMNRSTLDAVQEACRHELLSKHKEALLERKGSGVHVLLREKRLSDLARMYNLFALLDNGVPPMAKAFGQHVQRMGTELAESTARRRTEAGSSSSSAHRAAAASSSSASAAPPAAPAPSSSSSSAVAARAAAAAADAEYVPSLIALLTTFDTMVTAQFQGCGAFHKALQGAFRSFLCKSVAPVAQAGSSAQRGVGATSNVEMICAHADSVLSGKRKLGADAVDGEMESVMKLFHFLEDKDLFAEIYRNHLARRLLNRRSTSTEAEKAMISKMKLQCGAPFTSKLEGMMKDFLVGDDASRSYSAFVRKQTRAGPATMPPPAEAATDGDAEADADAGARVAGHDYGGGPEFDVRVLTTGFWPSYKHIEVDLPSALRGKLDAFEVWYAHGNKHRKIRWVHSLGDATVAARFGDHSYSMLLCPVQAFILLLFNTASGALSFDRLRETLHVDVEVLKRILHSMVCGKYKILLKSASTRGIKEDDEFHVNGKFNNKLRKFRVPIASLEASHNKKRVDEDRNFAIDAAIVRIMKTRKVLQHHELLTETLSQLHFFKPDPRAIKKRVEALIEREYLERDVSGGSTSTYTYLA